MAVAIGSPAEGNPYVQFAVPDVEFVMLDARKSASLLLIAIALGCLPSCSKQEPPPRSRDEIFRERMELPALYITAKSHKQVTAPAGKGMFIDAETGELCWHALACTNPDCPGRQDGEPYLFIEPDQGFYIKSDKTVGYNLAAARAAQWSDGTCPKCATIRNRAAESPEVRQRYVNWARPYVLPETAERMKALDEELKRCITYERTQWVAPDPGNRKPPQSSGGPQPTKADPASRP
jgi:hypothetical protein